MITPRQIQLVQIARRQVEKLSGGAFDEAAYQLALRNCGVAPGIDGRCSSKQLSQAGFEKFMAIAESLGFKNTQQGQTDYWQKRNARRTGYATTRQVWQIRRLAPLSRYPLHALCRRVSNDQHNDPEQLTIVQAVKLLEALKAIAARDPDAAKDAAPAAAGTPKDGAQGCEGKDAQQNSEVGG